MPIRTVARETRDLSADNDPDFVKANIGDQPLKAFASCGMLAGLALIVVDEHDLVLAPAQFKQTAAERSLIDGAFAVLENLLGAGLTQVNHTLALLVTRLNLGRSVHFPPPP